MATESWGQAVPASEEVDGAGLTVILGEDATVSALLRWDAIPGSHGLGNNLLPSELIGIPLRQSGTGVAVLHYRQLEGKSFGVGEEGFRRQHRNHDGKQMSTAGEEADYDHRLKQASARARTTRT